MKIGKGFIVALLGAVMMIVRDPKAVQSYTDAAAVVGAAVSAGAVKRDPKARSRAVDK